MFNKLLLWLFRLLLHPVATASMLYFIDREKNAVVVWMLNRENKKKLEQKAVEVDDSSSLLRLSTDEIPTEWNSKISDKKLSGSTYGTFSWFKFTTTTMRNSHSWTRRATTDHNNGNRISHFFHLLSPRLSKKHSARRWRCVGLHQASDDGDRDTSNFLCFRLAECQGERSLFFRSCFFSSFGALSFTNTRLGMMNESNVKCTRREKIDEIHFFLSSYYWSELLCAGLQPLTNLISHHEFLILFW